MIQLLPSIKIENFQIRSKESDTLQAVQPAAFDFKQPYTDCRLHKLLVECQLGIIPFKLAYGSVN